MASEGEEIVVGAGDSIPSIAKDRGFFWKTIWDDPKNASLKSLRQDPNVLYEGDKVWVRALETKSESCATEQLHEFKRLGDPLKFKVQLMRIGEPRKNEEYVLEMGGKIITGKTDGDGKLEEWMPGNTKDVRLILQGGKETYDFTVSRLDPADTTSGVQQRLNNLGYDCGDVNGELNDRTRGALRSFQADNGLEATGEIDAATKGKIKSLHP